MKFLFLFLFSILSISLFSQGKIDVLHYKFEIELYDLNDSIKGKALIRFIPLENAATFSFDLIMANTNKKGMIVTKCLLDKSNNSIIKVRQYGEKVFLNTSTLVQKGDTTSISISYTGIPAEGLIISKNKYGNRTFFADNWPNRARHWLPCVDDPADKASVDFIVTAPNQYQVISNGLQVEETNLPDNKKLTHWKETVELPTKVMVIGVAEFAVGYAGDAAGIPVYSWVYTQDKEKGFYDYAIAPEILSFFIDYIGPYPYKKLANVQSKTMFGGMENAGAIFYSENSVSGQRKEERLIAHEIVHQWFGNMATEKSFAHLWLSEGFATYLTHIYLEALYGIDSLNKRMEIDRNRILEFAINNHKPVVDSISAYMELLNANSYQKGGWVLHMLRRELGNSVFQRVIRTYYNRYKGKNADTQDFQAIVEEVSGKKMETFFRQWLYTPAVPKLKVTWQFNEKEKKLLITTEQLQKKVFSFPLEMKILFPDGQYRVISLNIISSKETLSIPVNLKPLNVRLDPDIFLLFEGTVEEKKK